MALKDLPSDERIKKLQEIKLKNSFDNHIKEEMRYKHQVKKEQAAYKDTENQKAVNDAYSEFFVDKPVTIDPPRATTTGTKTPVSIYSPYYVENTPYDESAVGATADNGVSQTTQSIGETPKDLLTGPVADGNGFTLFGVHFDNIDDANEVLKLAKEKQWDRVNKIINEKKEKGEIASVGLRTELSETQQMWNNNATGGSITSFMTPDEKLNYFALMQADVKSGKHSGKAEEYLDSLNLIDRATQKKAEKFEDKSDVEKVLNGAISGFLDTTSNILGVLETDANAKKKLRAYELDAAASRETLGGLGKFFYDVSSGATSMLTKQALSFGNSSAYTVMTGVEAAESGYRQALQEGRSEKDARNYGAATGVVALITEYALGAIGGSLPKAAKKYINENVSNVVWRFLGLFGVNFFSEATEGYVEGTTEKLKRNIVYGESNKYTAEDFLGEEILYNALIEGVVGGVMGSFADSVNNQAIAGKFDYEKAAKDTAKATGVKDAKVVDEIAQIAKDSKTPIIFTEQTFTDPITGKSKAGIEYHGVVYISANAANPDLVVVVHELIHTIQNTAQYQALRDEVANSEYIRSQYATFEEAVAEVQKNFAEKYGMDYTAQQAEAELVAMYVSENITKSPELQQLLRDNLSNGLRRFFANRRFNRQNASADTQTQERARMVRQLAEALRNRQNLTPEQINAIQQRFAEGDLTGAQYALVGVTPSGIEVYETSEEVKALPWREKRRIIVETIKNQYRGRTAKFEKDGKVYYATLDEGGVRKGVYGDKKSRDSGYDAKINIGADGNYFELVENSKYTNSSQEQGKKTRSGIHDGTKQWDYYQKTIIADGVTYGVLVNVADKGNDQYVYDVTLKEIKSSGSPSSNGINVALDKGRTTTNTKIPQNGAGVNTNFMTDGENYFSGANYAVSGATLEDVLAGNRDIDAEFQEAIDTYGEMNVDRPVATPKRVDDSGQKVSQAASTFLNNAETQQEVKMVKAGIVDAQYNYDPIKIEAAKEKARARIEGENGIGYDAAKKEVASRAADTDADAILNISPADYVYYGELYDMAVENGDYETAQNCLLVMFEAASVSGKILAIQRNRMRNLLSGISKSRAIQRDIARINNGFSAKYIEKYGRIEIPAEMYETLEKAVTPDEIEAAEAAIYDKAAEQWKATGWEKWRNYRYLAMLGNLKTWNKNTASNWANFGLSHSDNLVSVAWQKLWGKFDFEKASVILWYKTEHGKKIQPDLHKRSLEMAEAEASHKYQDSPQSEIESRRNKFGDSKVGRLLEKASEATDKIMQTGVIETVTKGKRGKKISGGDKAMFARAWEFYAGNYMVANNLTEITAEVENYATKAAQELVFHSDNGISKAVQNIRKSSKGAAAVIDFAMPFVKTPANVLQQGFQRSPAGLILNGTKLVTEMVKTHKNGGKVSAQTLNKFSRGVTGSMLFALGMLLANLGIASGKEDESAKGRSASELGGGQPLSLNVFGTSISFDWLEPASYPFLVGVLFEQGLEESDTSGAVFDALCAGYNEIFDMSMLAGLTEIFDSGSYGQDKNMIGDAAAKLLTNAATQSIPTVVGQLARTIDPVKRKTTSGDSVFTDVLGDNFLSDTASTIAARIPFASKLLEAERDVWGNEVGRSGDSALVNAINQFISPAAINGGSGYDDDLVTQIVMDLYEKTGDAKVIPTELDKNKAREELGSAYNSENYQDMRQDVGEAQHDAIYELVTSNTPIELYDNYVDANGKKRRRKYTKTFNEMTDEEKVKVISKTSTEAKSQAIEDYVEAFENILP